MVRTGDSLSLTMENTTATDATVRLFKLGASDDTEVTETNTVFSGTGRVDNVTFIYGGNIFNAGTTFGLTYDDATTDAVNIGTETPEQAAARVVSTFSGIGGCVITAGTDGGDDWVITISQVTNGKTPVQALIKGSGGDNFFTLTGSEPKPRTSNGVEIRSTPSYNFIKESQTGAPINVFTLDLETTSSSQIKEPIRYKRRDINGNEKVLNCTPTIDPYQYIGSSLLNISVSGFELDGNTQVIYTIKANTTVKLSLNYMTLRNCDLFKGAIRQRLAVERMRLLATTEKTDRGLLKVLVTPH